MCTLFVMKRKTLDSMYTCVFVILFKNAVRHLNCCCYILHNRVIDCQQVKYRDA